MENSSNNLDNNSQLPNSTTTSNSLDNFCITDQTADEIQRILRNYSDSMVDLFYEKLSMIEKLTDQELPDNKIIEFCTNFKESLEGSHNPELEHEESRFDIYIKIKNNETNLGDIEDINELDFYQETLLAVAISKNDFDLVSNLVNLENIDLEKNLTFDCSYLHVAAQCGNVDIANILINKDIDIKRKNDFDANALDYAIYNKNTELATLLASKMKPKRSLSCPNLIKSEPLYSAISNIKEI